MKTKCTQHTGTRASVHPRPPPEEGSLPLPATYLPNPLCRACARRDDNQKGHKPGWHGNQEASPDLNQIIVLEKDTFLIKIRETTLILSCHEGCQECVGEGGCGGGAQAGVAGQTLFSLA